jgi:hypothetical protein
LQGAQKRREDYGAVRDVLQMRLISIDPGVAGAGCACAAFNNETLEAVWFRRASRAPGLSERLADPCDVVVVERPELQGRRTRSARPQDLMSLAWEGALLAGTYVGRDNATLVELTPRQWKGSVPKPICHARLWRVLSIAEQNILGGMATEIAIEKAVEKGALNAWGRPGVSYYPKAFTVHNLLDAAGIGCFYLGRLTNEGK